MHNKIHLKLKCSIHKNMHGNHYQTHIKHDIFILAVFTLLDYFKLLDIMYQFLCFLADNNDNTLKSKDYGKLWQSHGKIHVT